MNISRLQAVVLFAFAAALLLAAPRAGSAEAIKPKVLIDQWEIQWFGKDAASNASPSLSAPWLKASTKKPSADMPANAAGAWIRLTVPPTADWLNPGLLASHMYGLDIDVYDGGKLLYRSTRDFSFDRNILLMDLEPKTEASELYIRIASMDRAGFNGAVRIGDYYELSNSFVREEIPSLLLGGSIAFVGLIMLLISGYLKTRQRGAWIALSLIALTTSVMILTFSTFTFVYFPEIGELLNFLFDLSMLVLFPALHYYVASVFEGKLAFFRRFGHWFAGYSAFCVLVLILNVAIGDPFFFYYKLFTFYILAPFILVHLLLVLSQSTIQAIRGNKNSIILAAGFLLFAAAGIADLTMIYASGSNPLVYLWQIGIVFMILSLVVVLARKISTDHNKLLSYSKELEVFNHRLQRTEKLKFISDLAASIAHEVRNPLQVTRGFLQLISRKSDEASRAHFAMAINELDRASTIITDFLTFAKPELDTVSLLDVQQEMTQIETIITPLAAYHGAVLNVIIPEKLYVLGNSSKFKQAFMNMIKNSIEALKTNGIVEIEAHAEEDMAVIRIADNGEGMEPEQIAKLGEPYYSTKTKGTGLGLMVTYRIIEVMQGTLEFRSEKGKGTEAYARFPLVRLDHTQ